MYKAFVTQQYESVQEINKENLAIQIHPESLVKEYNIITE